MMAGPQAAAMAALASQGQGQGQGQGQNGMNPASKAGATSASGTGGSSKSGTPQANAARKQGPIQLAKTTPNQDSRAANQSGRDVANPQRDSATPPWFAKLPPELRQAIRANGQARAPRGYEERLQQYFQNVD